MFENIDISPRPSIYLEIGVIVFTSFVLGFICGYIKLNKFNIFSRSKDNQNIRCNESTLNNTESIVTPTEIRATKTRDRKGNLVNKPKGNPNTN